MTKKLSTEEKLKRQAKRDIGKRVDVLVNAKEFIAKAVMLSEKHQGDYNDSTRDLAKIVLSQIDMLISWAFSEKGSL